VTGGSLVKPERFPADSADRDERPGGTEKLRAALVLENGREPQRQSRGMWSSSSR